MKLESYDIVCQKDGRYDLISGTTEIYSIGDVINRVIIDTDKPTTITMEGITLVHTSASTDSKYMPYSQRETIKTTDSMKLKASTEELASNINKVTK